MPLKPPAASTQEAAAIEQAAAGVGKDRLGAGLHRVSSTYRNSLALKQCAAEHGEPIGRDQLLAPPLARRLGRAAEGQPERAADLAAGVAGRFALAAVRRTARPARS